MMWRESAWNLRWASMPVRAMQRAEFFVLLARVFVLFQVQFRFVEAGQVDLVDVV